MLYLGKYIYVLGDFNCKFYKVENVTFKLKSVEIFWEMIWGNFPSFQWNNYSTNNLLWFFFYNLANL